MNNRLYSIIILVCWILVPFFSFAQKETIFDEHSIVSAKIYSANSVLATGTWYKIGLKNPGIYKLTYSDLENLGYNMPSVNPKNIRIYGNGGGMLPEANKDSRYDDLVENPIYVSGEDDGKFDANDYILFYGESPNVWEYNALLSTFQHKLNIYSDYNYYFITTDLGEGKRIQLLNSVDATPTDVVNTFNDYSCHENEDINLAKSGRIWLGEVFDAVTTYDFNFSFPDLDIQYPVKVCANVAAKYIYSSLFKVTVEGSVMPVSIGAVSSNSYYLADGEMATKSFSVTSSVVKVRVNYNKPSQSAIGWLNYLEVNAIRKLKFSGGQLAFRNISSVGEGKIAEMNLESSLNNVNVWDVTKPDKIAKVGLVANSGIYSYRWDSDTLHEFIAFDGTMFYKPELNGQVQNQNLHAIEPIDMVIVTHPDFLDEANRLATFHANHDNLSVVVVTTDQVYNEFSSGKQDITAIRDFMKMLFDKGAKESGPHYLLIFGDGSYDYKNYIQNNTNKVPTFQSEDSYHTIASYVTDDYYGKLDDNEGSASGAIDVGIGRIPVNTVEEATAMVDKIIYYSVQSEEIMGDWRNVICFVADDEESNTHMAQAEQMASFIDTTYSNYNVDKIYLDAYTQVATSGGTRYPEVNEAINKRIEKGALFLNYTGHGGEVGWAHERVLEISDIQSWTNIKKLPVFVTATCEFSRFDDPERESAGEMVYMNPDGGAIAMFTTTRPTYGGPNADLNMSFYKYAFLKYNNHLPAMGDILLQAKRENGTDTNGQKFILLGDPALIINYPQLKIVTTSLIDKVSGLPSDTLKALSNMIIQGEIHNQQNQKVTDFNGTVYVEVFDKEDEIVTRANDGGSAFSYLLRKNLIYKGKANVENGEFSLNFIVPKDIAFQYGFGKISYYAYNDQTDASGYNNEIVVGGISSQLADDGTGPEVKLFMNNEKFRFGGITDENPKLFAQVYDSCGINTVGSGIGHDIVAILDGNAEDQKVLNDFYESELNTFKSGTINYPFYNLSDGLHTLTLKVWDVFNNSSEAYTEFFVKNSGKFNLNEVDNYPNPMEDQTSFRFRHNQAGKQMDVTVRIYALDGRLVKTLKNSFVSENYTSIAAVWNGKDDRGNRLSQGMYVYTIGIKIKDGFFAEKSGKLVIAKN